MLRFNYVYHQVEQWEIAMFPVHPLRSTLIEAYDPALLFTKGIETFIKPPAKLRALQQCYKDGIAKFKESPNETESL